MRPLSKLLVGARETLQLRDSGRCADCDTDLIDGGRWRHLLARRVGDIRTGRDESLARRRHRAAQLAIGRRCGSQPSILRVFSPGGSGLCER